MAKRSDDDRSILSIDKGRKHKIFLPTSDSGGLWKILKDDGYEITLKETDDYDVVLFAGTSPISPMYYGEAPIFNDSMLQPNFIRDRREWRILRKLPRGMPKIGIGRGAHLLNAFNGGSSLQNVSGHAKIHTGVHKIFLPAYQDTVEVQSEHFQLMVPGDGANVLANAQKSHLKISYGYHRGYTREERLGIWDDAEIVHYWYNSSLCFEPLPYAGHVETEALFLLMTEQLIEGKLE